MVDQIKPTPKQYPMVSGVADGLRYIDDFVSKPFGYENPPGKILSEVLGIPAVIRTLDRVSYGEPLVTGKGQTTQLKPDTVDAALSVLPLAGKIVQAGPYAMEKLGPKASDMAEKYLIDKGLVKHVQAHHASRHSFDKFDSSKAGSGEGQSFGHGLYFAGDDSTMREYLQAFNHNAKIPPTRYTVDIADNKVNKMMDWSKKIKDQPESVQTAVRKLLHDFPANALEKRTASRVEDLDGESVYRFISERNSVPGGTLGMADKAASNALFNSGIPGHTFPREYNPTGAQYKPNYVVYPGSDDHIKIVDKFKYTE